MNRHEEEEFLNKYCKVIFPARKDRLPPNYHTIKCLQTNKILFTITFLYSPLNTKNTLIFYHGNGEVVEDYLNSEFQNKLIEKVNICMVEYRGYGPFSQCDVAVMDMLTKDVPLLHSYLKKNFYIEDENIVVMGRSIGSIFASHFAFLFPLIRSFFLTLIYVIMNK